MKEIRFGTSGWRAVISEDFTFDNVRLVAQAIANYINKLKTHPPPPLCLAAAILKVVGDSPPKPRLWRTKLKTVVVGYDTRFLSEEFAKETAKVLSANGIRVLLSNRDVPTPVISYHIIKNRCLGGINFTASHNPPQYNGIKFSPASGGPAPLNVTRAIEKNIAKLRRRMPISYKAREGLIDIFDPRPAYLTQIEKIIDIKAIKKARLKVALDCLYGTSRGYLDYLLKGQNCTLEVLHDYLNPYFDGKRPEPAPENITELISLVKKKRLHLGLATDGDGDRFGIVDSDASYITPNQVITLLFHHLLKTRETPRKKVVARTIATTHMIDAIAERHGIEVVETPVGFKYFVDILNRGDCVIAGEESGGLSISGHLPEKDGILACLLITEMVAINRKPIRDILKVLYRTYGRFYSERIDLALPKERKKRLIERLKSSSLKEFAHLKILKRDLRDGVKLYLEDGNWVLFRPSGTEPIVRSYYESKSKKVLSELIKTGKEISRF